MAVTRRWVESSSVSFWRPASTDVRASASFDFFGSTEDVAFFHAFIMDWFYSPEVIAAATKFRLAHPRAVRRVARRP